MAIEQEETVVAPPEARTARKTTVVFVLSAVLGVLLLADAFGAFAYFRQTSALRRELAMAKEALKQKSTALSEANAKNDGLAQQMRALREHAVAHSTGNAAKEKEEQKTAVPKQVVGTQPSSESSKKTVVVDQGATQKVDMRSVPALPPAKAGKAPVTIEDCELVGKLAAEQAATLKRCVGVMDGLASTGVGKTPAR